MKMSVAEIEQLVRRRGKIVDLPFGLGVFDHEAVAAFDRSNFDHLHLAPRFFDAIRGRADRCPILWADVRASLFAATRQLNTPPRLTILYDAMRAVAQREAEHQQDMDATVFAERVICEPLVDLVMAGMTPRERRALIADQHAKIANVLHPAERLRVGLERPFPALKSWRDMFKQINAGRAVQHHLRRRLEGKAPPAIDYAAAVLSQIDALGVARASYVLSTVLTAIAGAPGTVAACMLYELLRHPSWRDRVACELAEVPLDHLVADPMRTAPISYCVIRETMRLWSFPLMIGRPVYRPFDFNGKGTMPAGATYWLSSYVMHRDQDYWDDPQSFDPARWSNEDPARRHVFAPFGWGPRTCVGANLGLAQYFLFLRIALVEWRMIPIDPEAVSMGLDGVAAPENMIVQLTRR